MKTIDENMLKWTAKPKAAQGNISDTVNTEKRQWKNRPAKVR